MPSAPRHELLAVHLTGWKAWVAGSVVVALLLHKAFGSPTVDDPVLLEALRAELRSEAYRDRIPDVQRALEEDRLDQVVAGAEELVGTRVELLSAVGSAPIVPFVGRRELVVRVRFELDDLAAEQRFYTVRRQPLSGDWRVGAEVSALRFYLDLL